MLPIQIPDEAAAELADGFERVSFGEGQGEYLPLPAIVTGPERRVLTWWEPTDEERAAISQGAPVELSVLTFGMPLQPIAIYVAEPAVSA